MADRLSRIMKNHYKKAIREPNPYLVYAMDESNCKKWYIAVKGILGDNDELKGGEYIFSVTAEDKPDAGQSFPHTPPDFRALTPNGVYTVNVICCISIGTWHKNQYRSVLGMSGFCTEVMNGLINHKLLKGGVNIICSNDATKKKLAGESMDYNDKNNTEIIALLRESYAEYSKAWDLSGKSEEEIASYNFRDIVFDKKTEKVEEEDED